MVEPIKLDTTVPAYAIARGSLVNFDICLNETERRQLSERFAFIKLEEVIGKIALAQIADGCWELSVGCLGQLGAGIVFWVSPSVFWVLVVVFWVSGFVFWVLGLVFWVLGLVF